MNINTLCRQNYEIFKVKLCTPYNKKISVIGLITVIRRYAVIDVVRSMARSTALSWDSRDRILQTGRRHPSFSSSAAKSGFCLKETRHQQLPALLP
jgi:hypothetical protein